MAKSKAQLEKENEKWREKVDIVTKLINRGYKAEQIISVTGYKEEDVHKICEDDRITGEAARQNFKDKSKIAEDIIGLGLEVVRAAMVDLRDPEIRRKMVTKISDVKDLLKEIQALDAMLQPPVKGPEVQGTITFEGTREAFQQLRKKDPIFDYPALPEPKEDDGSQPV